MKVLVLGIGKMGYGLLKDLAMQPDIHEIVAADVNVGRAQQVVERVNSDKIEVRYYDVMKSRETARAEGWI